jgi:hypothetical protein
MRRSKRKISQTFIPDVSEISRFWMPDVAIAIPKCPSEAARDLQLDLMAQSPHTAPASLTVKLRD